MALATVNLKALIDELTNSLISSYNYEALRRLILDRKPLVIVCAEIQKSLTLECDKDKADSKVRLTNDAFTAQQQSDKFEEARDNAAAQAAENLKAQHQFTKPRLEQEINSLTMQIAIQQNLYDAVNQRYKAYKLQLDDIDNQIAINAAVDTGVLLVSALSHSHHSHHSPNHHHHNHHHCLPPQVNYEMQQLRFQRSTIQGSVDIEQSSRSSAETTLRRLKAEKQTKENELASINEQLLITLPRQVIERNERQNERASRDSYRKKGSDLNQLSHLNLQKLESEIKSAASKLNDLQRKLEQDVANQSYSKFLTLFENYLPRSHFVENDSAALSNIIKSMKNYFEMEKEEIRLKDGLSLQRLQLGQIQKEITAKQKLLTDWPTKKASFESRKTQLENSNKELESEKQSFIKIRSRLLRVSSGAAIIAVILTVLLFAVPLTGPIGIILLAVDAALTLSLLIAALVYHYKADSKGDKINTNLFQISGIARDIEGGGKGCEANLANIETLKNQETQLQEAIEKSQQSLSVHQEQMCITLQKINTITPNDLSPKNVSGCGSAFFSQSPRDRDSLYPDLGNNPTPSVKPSAPPASPPSYEKAMEEDQLNHSSTPK